MRIHPCGPAPRACPRRRGIASLLAMLYLVVFAALAMGFYAQTNISAQLAGNELRAAQALAAAESGMAFMRYELAHVATEYKVDESAMLVELANCLADRMNDTSNLVFGGSYQEVGMSSTGDAIYIPGDETAVIPLGNGTGFRCKITRTGRQFVVKVVGRSADGSVAAAAGAGRGVEYTFEPKQIPTTLFDYGVATRGTVTMDSNATITGVPESKGTLLTTATGSNILTMKGTNSISGQVFFESATATYSVSSGSEIANQSTPSGIAANVIKDTDAPEFPVIDTSAYAPFATNTLSTVNGTYTTGTLRNIRIKANTNPTFDSDLVIEGVVYIEQPNQVNFKSNVLVKGVVVVDNKNSGSSATNYIKFDSNVKVTGMGGLPLPTVDPLLDPFPPAMRALTGSTILAPNFNLHFNSNFGAAGGSVVGGSMYFDSNASMTIDGSMIALDGKPTQMMGNTALTFTPTGASAWPAGIKFRSSYTPRASTYREFHPSGEQL